MKLTGTKSEVIGGDEGDHVNQHPLYSYLVHLFTVSTTCKVEELLPWWGSKKMTIDMDIQNDIFRYMNKASQS